MESARRGHRTRTTGDGRAASGAKLVLLLVALLLPATAARAQGVLESPAPGSVKSGIGILSGWKCSASSATSITLTIDGGAPIQAAYGTSRGDTAGACGDADNGYGVLFNYGLLADGEHEVVAADAGVEFARASFSTTRFGTSFLVGASGVAFVRDFPATGQGAFMAWDQGAQGFTVGGTCGTAGTVACPPPFSLSGWTYADQESAAGPYTSATSSASSMGQANTITRTGVGAYEVRFGGLTSGSDTTSGVMHVTARQGNANFCVVGGWDPDGTDRVASVFCYDAAGAPADTRFDVVFTRPAAGNEIRAFLWANAPSDDAYVPDLVYQYSAAGPIAAIERFAAGRYRAYLPALSRDDRLGFMLSAYGGEPRRCRVVDLGIRDDGRFGVDVACEDAAGAPADSRFTLSVIRDAALAPMPYNVLAAYVRTRDAVTAEVGPDETYNEVGGTNTASRTATGRYVVRLGSFAPYGVVGNLQLTAVGEGVSHCTIESMGAAGNDIEVVVLCFDGATPTNSEFMLTYGR